MEAQHFGGPLGSSVQGLPPHYLFRASSLNIVSVLELAVLCQSCMNRRYGSHKVASCLHTYSASKLTTLLTPSCRAWFAPCLWTVLLCVRGKSVSRLERAMRLSIQDWMCENGFKGRHRGAKLTKVSFWVQTR